MLFATALTNESIADALANPRYRGVYIALAREILAVATARGVKPESFDGFDPMAYLPSAPQGAAEQIARRSRRVQSPIGEDTQRNLARSRGAKAAHGSRCAARHRGDAGAGSGRLSPTPLLSRLVELIHDIESGVREQSLETLDALAAMASDDSIRV